jgi:hypothetical protein
MISYPTYAAAAATSTASPAQGLIAPAMATSSHSPPAMATVRAIVRPATTRRLCVVGVMSP